jgi:hypothetical protein
MRDLIVHAGDRLSWDCATLGRMIVVERPPARARLEAALGEGLARVLRAELRANPRYTTRRRAVEGSRYPTRSRTVLRRTAAPASRLIA